MNALPNKWFAGAVGAIIFALAAFAHDQHQEKHYWENRAKFYYNASVIVEGAATSRIDKGQNIVHLVSRDRTMDVIIMDRGN